MLFRNRFQGTIIAGVCIKPEFKLPKNQENKIMTKTSRKSISGDMLSKLYNGRFSGIKSKYFQARGIVVEHYDTVKSKAFTNDRNASLPLLDGLALVLAGGIRAAKSEIILDGQNNRMAMKTFCVIEPDVHSEICSFAPYQMRAMNGKIFSRLYRQPGVTTFVTELSSTGKNPKPNEGSCEPSIFSVVLAEAIGDVMLNRHGAHLTSKGIVQAWSDFLSDWRWCKDLVFIDDVDMELKRKVLLMSDWAWCGLAYQENSSLLSTERSIPFVSTTAEPSITIPSSNSVRVTQSEDFGELINDYYLINGLTKVLDTFKLAPNAISATN
jgi:hypothetical protein